MVSAMQGAGGVGRPGNPWLGYGSGSARSRGGCAYRTGPRQDVRGETGGLHDDRSDAGGPMFGTKADLDVLRADQRVVLCSMQAWFPPREKDLAEPAPHKSGAQQRGTCR